jgi:hypothetical protein
MVTELFLTNDSNLFLDMQIRSELRELLGNTKKMHTPDLHYYKCYYERNNILILQFFRQLLFLKLSKNHLFQIYNVLMQKQCYQYSKKSFVTDIQCINNVEQKIVKTLFFKY